MSFDSVLVFLCFFFFFKQKTAYEMRISDWSSDVCSSDLIYKEIRCRKSLPEARKSHPWFAESIYWGAPSSFFVTRGRQRRFFSLYARQKRQIGRASCRARVCQYV